MEDNHMDNVSKNEIIERIEYIMSYILSKKYDCDIKIHLKKEKITNGNTDSSRDFGEK